MKRRWICWPPDSVCCAGECTRCVPPAEERGWLGGSPGRRKISLVGLIALPQGWHVSIDALTDSMDRRDVRRSR